MKRVCRRLLVATALLVWLGALVYLLVLSRRRLPELGAAGPGGPGAGAGGPGGPGAGAGAAEAAGGQVSPAPLHHHRVCLWRCV